MTAINGQVISIQANSLSANPLETVRPPSRQVTVDSDTAIVKLVPLTDAEFTAAMAIFNADSKAGKPSAMPTPYKESPATLADVNSNDFITVTAATDILNAESFTATKIVVTPSP